MSKPPPPNAAIAEIVHGLGDEDARELVGMFLKSFDPTLVALAGENPEEQRRAAHSLKSSARIVGLIELSGLMIELENRLSKTDSTVTETDISDARREFEKHVATLRAFATVAGS